MGTFYLDSTTSEETTMVDMSRFTDRARKVMHLAQQEARRLGHEYLGTEHILLGLVKEGSGVAGRVLGILKVDSAGVRAGTEKLLHACPEILDHDTKLPKTPRAAKVLDFAGFEASQLGHNYVGTEHLLLGLLREGEGVACTVLTNLGLPLEQVRTAVVELLQPDKRPDPSDDRPWAFEVKHTVPTRRAPNDALTVALIESATEILVVSLEMARAGTCPSKEMMELSNKAMDILQKQYDQHLHPLVKADMSPTPQQFREIMKLPPVSGGPVELDDAARHRITEAMDRLMAGEPTMGPSGILSSLPEGQWTTATPLVQTAEEYAESIKVYNLRLKRMQKTVEQCTVGVPTEPIPALAFTCAKCLQPTPTLYTYTDAYRSLQVCLACLHYLQVPLKDSK